MQQEHCQNCGGPVEAGAYECQFCSSPILQPQPNQPSQARAMAEAVNRARTTQTANPLATAKRDVKTYAPAPVQPRALQKHQQPQNLSRITATIFGLIGLLTFGLLSPLYFLYVGIKGRYSKIRNFGFLYLIVTVLFSFMLDSDFSGLDILLVLGLIVSWVHIIVTHIALLRGRLES